MKGPSQIEKKFLPRAHSQRYGWFDKSNWKNLTDPRNLRRVDPAIRDVIRLLNEKGYSTYSSCSGGHESDQRRKRQRHVEGYIAFSPPSRVAFDLYFSLQGRVKDFQLSATVGVLDEDNSLDQTMYSELRWQLDDRAPSRRTYYDMFMERLKQAAEAVPPADQIDQAGYLYSLVGDKHAGRGKRILEEQSQRFH